MSTIFYYLYNILISKNSNNRFVTLVIHKSKKFIMKCLFLYVAAFLLCFGMSTRMYSQNTSMHIVVDQFGYLPTSEKYAIIRNPQVGYDSNQSFEPGNTYAVVHATSNAIVYESSLEIWKNGMVDNSSGDICWNFDFSEVTDFGEYYILDLENQIRSFTFQISPAVYNEILKQAMRTFFYQRSGFAKEAQYAGIAYEDGASHIGPGQDKECRLYNQKNNASTERDVHGGWYDAGDFNKYTNWTANYVTEFALAYLEKPDAWADDYNIPESGNGVPDIIDEMKWGTDHLLRLIENNGSVISIVDAAEASPPSSGTENSYYGSVSTSATQNTSAALAAAALVFKAINNDNYAEELISYAEKCWSWALDNPSVTFYNNTSSNGSQGIGAGQQEEDDYGRMMSKLEAAIFLYAATNKVEYKNYVESHYEEAHMFQWNFVYPFEANNQTMLLFYASLDGVSSFVKDKIVDTYKVALNSSDNLGAQTNQSDPYLSYMKDYVWGSNSTKCHQGNIFMNAKQYGVDLTIDEALLAYAQRYIHYIHGVNPMNFVYLSNMYKYGAENGVNEFYHTWFSNGSPLWDRVGESKYGPAPGFLVGGANPSYDYDACCPNNCGGAGNNAVCVSENLSPPKGQPKQKSYKDFNTSWPLNSWSVTENSNGYQIPYIRLLSKFVDISYDCNGEKNGEAIVDICGVCSGGNTGIEPILDETECGLSAVEVSQNYPGIQLFPNPSDGHFEISKTNFEFKYIRVYDVHGKLLLDLDSTNHKINLSAFSDGMYIVQIGLQNDVIYRVVTKQ